MAAETQVRKEDVIPIKLILIFAILSVGIIAAGYITYSGYKKHYLTEVERELTAIADLKAAQVVRWLGDCKGDAEMIFNNALFSNLARRYLKNPQDGEAERQLRGWLEQYSKGYDYDQIGLYDTQGVTRMSVPAGLPPASAAITNRITKVLQSGRITVVDFYRHDYDHRIYLSMLIPIHDVSAGKRAICVLSMRVDPEKYLYPFILRWPTPSQTAETLLVRRDGNDVVFLVDLRFRKDAALKLRIPLNRTNNPAVMAVLGRTGIVEGVDYRGQPVIADIRPVPDSPWFLVARKNTSEVYVQTRGHLWMIVEFVTVLLFGAGAGLAFVWRQQTIAFYKERKQAADVLLQEKTFSDKLFNGPRDTVFLFEPATGKPIRWNKRFLEVSGYRDEEIAGMKAPDDFYDEEDLKRAKECMVQIFSEGQGVVEMSLVTKSGMRIPFEYAANVIETVDGKTLFLSIGRDISQRKKAEEAQILLSAIVESSDDAIISKDLGGTILSWNAGAQKIYGYSADEIVGKSVSLLVPPEITDEIPAILERLKKGEETKQYETERIRKDGSRIFVSVAVSPIRDAAGKIFGASTIARDITERKRAEEALRESEEKFRLFMEYSPVYVFFKDENIRAIHLSRNFEQMLGRPVHELLGKTMNELFPSELAKRMIEDDRRVLREGKPLQIEEEFNGRFYSTLKFPILFEGKSRFLAGFTVDITERRQIEEERQKISEELRDLYDNAPCGYHSLDANGVFVRMNDTELSWLGYSREEILEKKRFTDIITEKSLEIFKKNFPGFKERGWVYGLEFEMIRKDGTIMPVILSATAVKDAADNFIMSRSTIYDITERKMAEENMLLQAAVFANTSEGIMITNRDALLESVNNAFVKITGYSVEEAIGQNPRILKSGRHDAIFYKNVWTALLEKGEWKGDFWNKRKNGEIYPQETSINCVRDKDCNIIKYVAIFSDITERKRTEETLRLLSMHDGLTGLNNRRAFDEYFNTEWRRAIRNGYSIALGMLDIDYFKKYNDMYGHLKGDDCLKSVANALKESLKRPGDMAARYGGEEFVFVLPMSDAEHSSQIAEVIRSTIALLKIPHESSEVSDYVTVSIGVASVIPLPNSTSQSLIERADRALYQAKYKGRNNVQVFREV